MARLTLVVSKPPSRVSNTRLDPAAGAGHRASASEGESARRLLEDQGFPIKRTANGQHESRCPFHEGPGPLEARKGTNFYLNAENSKYACQSASCGERGNLQTLERFFGVGEDDSWSVAFKSREANLEGFEAALTEELAKPFRDQGLTAATIKRFRLGYEAGHSDPVTGKWIGPRYVIPYLEGRRPRFFRYYQPKTMPGVNPDTWEEKWKYTWESGAESTLFNGQDAIGDADGRVFICEGEQKAMLLVQMGYAAVAVPGCSQWKDDWQAQFTHAHHIYICYDNDNVDFQIKEECPRCFVKGLDRCVGHNHGQDAAMKRLEDLGWRAKNVVLPLPSRDVAKTDINDFFMRDGRTNADFAEIATGKRITPFKVQNLTEITASPPDEAKFLIEQGILPAGGRLLVAGKPKVGKSIFIDNLALSLAAGIPFLGRYQVDRPTRVLLLDRELSKWSLYNRLHALMDSRPGYRAGMDNLLIDHDHLLRLDVKGAYETLLQLVEQNGAEVVILDTAYKFFGGDVEKASSLSRAFEVLDRVLHETGCSVILTHHHKKGASAGKRENNDIADPDNVAGSFLWTGWPNSTILLNYLNRSVENPFNAIATFTAFRDAAPPEPVALYRSRESIAYSAIQDYSHEDMSAEASTPVQFGKPTTEGVAAMLLERVPCTEEDFLHVTAAQLGCTLPTLRPFFVDAMASGHFERTTGKPAIIKFKGHQEEESWEAEHGLPERPPPSSFDDVDMFDAAGLL